MKKKFKFFIVVYIANLVVLFLVNTGFEADIWWEDVQTIILASGFSLGIFWAQLRKFILLLSTVFIFVMVILYILKQFEMANLFGSTAIGLFFLSLICYLPQLVRKGYIEKI